MDSKQLFSILPKQFFSILASQNQMIYVDCLFLMYQFLTNKNSFGCKKDVLIDLLSDYFSKDANFHDGQPIREKVNHILRRLNMTGWIFEEEDNNYEVLVHFTHYSIPILKTFGDLQKNDELEYLGYIYLIYSALKNIELNSLNDILDQIQQNTNIVMNKLKSLNSNIKNYLQNLLDRKDQQDLKSIVENLFVDYKKDIIDCHYQRLKTSDNIIKYRPFIISQLNDISLNEETMNYLSQDLVNKNKYESLQDAKVHLYQLIDYIIKSFENFDDIMDEIDKKNAKYIHTSISKILFIVNNTQDVQGKLTKIIQHQIETYQNKPHAFKESFYRLSLQKYLDDNSLYTMPNYSGEKEIQIINDEKSLSYKEKQDRLLALLENGKYNIQNIDSYVKQLLNEKREVQASHLPLDNYEDYTKLILIYLYSNNEVNYRIKPFYERYERNGYSFYNFKIMKK